MAVLAKKKSYRGMIIPADNAQEAAVVEAVKIFGMQTLPQVVEFLLGRQAIEPAAKATAVCITGLASPVARYPASALPAGRINV